MVEVVPAIIPESFAELEEKVARVASLVPLVQVDVCDGIFVPFKSWPYDSWPNSDFEALLGEVRKLPFLEKVSYEVDLMVKNPRQAAFDWITAGAVRVIIHVESSADPAELIREICTRYGNSAESRTVVEVGIAVGQETALESIEPLITLVDVVQIMGIARIGSQGEPFDGRTYGRLRALREKYPKLILSVDGGVSAENAGRLVASGANRLVSGSYIYMSDDPRMAIETLKRA